MEITAQRLHTNFYQSAVQATCTMNIIIIYKMSCSFCDGFNHLLLVNGGSTVCTKDCVLGCVCLCDQKTVSLHSYVYLSSIFDILHVVV